MPTSLLTPIDDDNTYVRYERIRAEGGPSAHLQSSWRGVEDWCRRFAYECLHRDPRQLTVHGRISKLSEAQTTRSAQYRLIHNEGAAGRGANFTPLPADRPHNWMDEQRSHVSRAATLDV